MKKDTQNYRLTFFRYGIFTLTFFVLSFSVFIVDATNYFVNDNSISGDIFCLAVGNNTNNGTSSSTPKLTLKNLINTYGPSGTNVLTSGDIIKIDAGTYMTDATIDFYISGITFQGAGSNLTIFDNNGAGGGYNYFMYIGASNVVLKNMTLKKYYDLGTAGPGAINGQVITVGGGSTGVLIENVITSANGGSGGNPSIVVLANTSVTIKGGGGLCNVWRSSYTGGIQAYGNGITLNIQDYILAYNYKTNSYDGGGLLINNGNATTTVNVTNTRFYNNEASDGGAISQRNGVLNVTDCIIDANMAGQTATPIYGGGIRMTGGTATYTRTKFTNNTLGSAGGTLRGAAIGLYSLDDNINLTLNNCFFSGNIGAEGDDLYADKNSSKTVNVFATNTTFSSSAKSIFNKDADLIQLTNCGNPTIQTGCSNSPAVIKVNTTLPSSIPTPNPQIILSGDCSSTIVLPIELTTFKGMCLKNKIELFWQTASETNNDYFIIEKSIDGINFTQIGTVEGNGNSNTLKNYIYSDSDVSNKNNFYRLTQVDFDSKYSQSEIIVVLNSCNDIGFEFSNAYYNSSNNEITLSFLTNLSGKIHVSVTDILGRDIYNNVIETQEGINNNNIQINSFSNAVYIISLYNEAFKVHKKIYININ